MFTGLIRGLAKITQIEGTDEKQMRFHVAGLDKLPEEGASVSCNGCCLTAVAIAAGRVEFDLLAESVRLTSIGEVGPGGVVNLERALQPTSRMGGHFVTGHVDRTGVIEALESRGKDYFLRIRPEAEDLKYVVHKGCIAVDGISLTVAEVDATGFAIWLIPHTMEVTNEQPRRGHCPLPDAPGCVHRGRR